MKKVHGFFNSRRIVVVVVLSVLLFSTAIISVWYMESSNLSWSVEEEAEYTYEVSLLSIKGGGNPWNTFYNESFTIRITSLPEILIPLTVSAFLTDVVAHQKVEIEYVNGSAIEESFATTISACVSNLILPVGAWGLFDVFYPDHGLTEFTMDIAGNEYHTRYSTNGDAGFLFEHIYYELGYRSGGGGGWRGVLDLENGLPLYVCLLNTYYLPSGTHSVTCMNLTLVN